MKRNRFATAAHGLDRRALLQSLAFAGAAASSPVLGKLTIPAHTPAPSDDPSPDWPALALRDHKPIQPNFDNVQARGQRRMVTSDHPLATWAALDALKRGGSAADAYMTAALTQCVLEPTMTTLGGGFGMTMWHAAEGALGMGGGSFSFPENSPASEPWDEQKSWTGWGAMVPGYVRGLEACHEAWGRLEWKDLFEPAITFAEQGFVIDHLLFAYAKETRKMIGRYPGAGRDDWFRNGFMLGVGDTLRQPALAKTLRMLRDEGPDSFYAGPFAKRLADEVQKRGGTITTQDLEAVRAFAVPSVWKPGAPGATSYRGFVVPPVVGELFQLGLQVLEQADLADLGRPTENVEALHVQMRTMQELWLRGGDLTPANREHFVSKEHATQVLSDIRKGPARPFRGFSAATCGLVVVDDEGNVACGTHSSSSEPFGGGINVDGVILNRAVFLRKYPDMPRGFSTQMWLFRDDQPVLAMATPSRSFIECLLQATANLVEYDMDFEAATRAPRFGHPHPGMDAAEIEASFPETHFSELERRGHVLFPVSPNDVNAGPVQGVRRAADGTLEGVADPRRRGLAAGA